MDILGNIKTNYSSNYYNSKRINRSDKGFGNVSRAKEELIKLLGEEDSDEFGKGDAKL